MTRKTWWRTVLITATITALACYAAAALACRGERRPITGPVLFPCDKAEVGQTRLGNWTIDCADGSYHIVDAVLVIGVDTLERPYIGRPIGPGL